MRANFCLAAIMGIALSMPLDAGYFASAQAANCSASPEAGVDWRDCRKRNLILEGSDLSSANLADADFSSTDLRGTKLGGANFTKAALARAMLDDSKAQEANFEKALGYRTSFVNADLAGASFAKSEMQRADFSNATLVNVDFDKSELGRVNFSGAKIDNTHFRYCNLARADFRTANFSTPIDFTGSYLYQTRLEGLDLSEATIVQWQIDMSCGDENTKLPEGLNPSPDWPCTDEE